ncbi:hypothetical protein [Salinibacter grassmerensis]|uniref:hypothetical protein n=1 Tax=Salinibacter grassmerensis TaxID=3040353 RepID=UPI0021E944F1|nr:hypothetical protein [Salinibacter grassmerensis]
MYLDPLPVVLVLLQIAATTASPFALAFVVSRKLSKQKEAPAEHIDLLQHKLSHRVGNDPGVEVNRLEMAKQSKIAEQGQMARQTGTDNPALSVVRFTAQNRPEWDRSIGRSAGRLARSVRGRCSA